MTTNTQVGNYPPLPAKVIKIVDESFAPGRAPESLLALAADLGWSAYHAEFFKAAAQKGWVKLSDFDSAKALLMFTQEMFNQFKSPGGAELEACEELLMAHSFTSVGPGLAGLCRNPDRAASVSAVFETAPSAGDIPALALIALADDYQWSKWTQLDYVSAERTLVALVADLLSDADANEALSVALDPKRFKGVSGFPSVPGLVSDLEQWSKLLPSAPPGHVVDLAMSPSFTPVDYRAIDFYLHLPGESFAALFLEELLSPDRHGSFYEAPVAAFSTLASVLPGRSLAEVAAVYNRRITAQSAAQWLALNPDMSVGLLIAAANPGISSYPSPCRLGLRDKVSLRPAVRVCQALVDAEQARIAGGFLKSSASALVSLQSQPQLSPVPAVRRRLFSRSAPPAVAVFPSEQAQGAMVEVEKIKGEYIRLSMEPTTYLHMPAFLHRDYKPVDEFLILLVAFQDAVYSRDSLKVVSAGQAVATQFALAQEKAGSKDGADFLWHCDEGSQILSKVATLSRESRLASGGTPEAASAGEKMEETMGSLALLLGGPAEMEERLALGGGLRQLPSVASSVFPAPSSLG